MKKCLGCGQEIQNTDPTKKGYVVNLDNDYCLRCFKIKHYNELINVDDIKESDFANNVNSIINSLTKTDHVFYILDAFNLSSSRVPSLEAKLNADNTSILVNKIDLMPYSTNWDKLIEYVEQIFKSTPLADAEIILFSALKNVGVDGLKESLDEYKNNYFIGKTNVGKSSIINKIIKSYGEQPNIVESYFANTTMDKIEIKLNDKSTIVDTPGIGEDNSFSEITIPSDWKLLFPKKEVKQFSFQLTNTQSIVYGSIFSIDFNLIDKRDIHVYANQFIDLHRTNTNNLAEYYEKNWNKVSPQVRELKPLITKELDLSNIKNEKEITIAIQDLGWVSLKVKPGDKITYHVPESVINPDIKIVDKLM